MIGNHERSIKALRLQEEISVSCEGLWQRTEIILKPHIMMDVQLTGKMAMFKMCWIPHSLDQDVLLASVVADPPRRLQSQLLVKRKRKCQYWSTKAGEPMRCPCPCT